MALVKELTKLTVVDLWREVKDEEEWWGDFKEEVLRLVKRLLEGAMEEEMMEELRAGAISASPGASKSPGAGVFPFGGEHPAGGSSTGSSPRGGSQC